MRSFIMLFVVAMFCLLADSATAINFVTVKLQSHPGPDDLLKTCRNQGGYYEEGGGSYSCSKSCAPNAGCKVNCNQDGCTGTTPARLVPKSKDVEGILNASKRPTTRVNR